MFLTPADLVRDYQARGWWAGESVDALFARTAAAGGDVEALVDPPNRVALDGRAPERLGWATLADRVQRLCVVLDAAGLRKDDRVVAQLPNTVDAVLLFLACARMGLILSPVVMQYRAHELEHVVALTEPRAFVTVPAFAGFDHAAQARRLLREGEVLLFGDGVDDLPARMAPVADPSTFVPAPAEGGEVLTICWTSGTEARPKGVPRDHNHWILNGRVVADGTGMVAGDTLLNPFPLVNIGSIGGLVMPWLLLGGKLVLHHPFDLGVFLRQLQDERVTYTIAPPAVLTALLKQPGLMADVDLSALRAVGSGSAPLSPWLIEGWQTHGIEICNIFGSNEGASLFSSAAHVPDPAQRARFFPRLGVDGQDWPGLTHRVVRSRLVDPDTEQEVTEPGRAGELRITGAATFSGYWRAPEQNAQAFDAAGWFRTGDLFEIAGEGDLRRFYRFVGRCKEIIVRGGVNISPAEIDDLLVGLPSIREAAAVGVPDDDLGERVAIAVVAQDGRTPTIADVTAWLAARDVAIFKRPERLVVLDSLPRNAMNKVVRRNLRALVMERLAAGSRP